MALISKGENNSFRLTRAVTVCGRQVLYRVFCWGTPDKPPDIKLDDYLNKLPPTSSANYLRHKSNFRFSKTDKNLISNSPDGTGFSVHLLYLSIRLACENVAPLHDPKWFSPSTKMEYFVTAVKNMRNDVIHSQRPVPDEEYFLTMMKLREVLTGCLLSSGERYWRDKEEVKSEIQQMNNNLDYIMSEILGEEDIIMYTSDNIKEIIINDSCNELKRVFQNMTFINPVSFLGIDLPLRVDNNFINIEVKLGNRRGEGEHIDYQDLFELLQTTSVSLPARPKILLLEGLAESGKTTLMKLITGKWADGSQGQIKGLDNYQLLLWVECRDSTMDSYQHLQHRLLPNISLNFGNALSKIIKLCKVLILIDGLDELNDSSTALVKGLLHEFQNSPYITFICTSRPEKVEMFRLMIPEEYEVTYAELLGIKKEYLKEFVIRTHREITRYTNTNRSTEKLLNKLKSFEGLHEHLRLPSNLTLFVYLWDQPSDEINTMTITETEIYHEIHLLCQRKLLKRLMNKDRNEIHLMDKIQEILRTLYIISLDSLSRQQLILDEAAVDRLISTCDAYDIPYDEILSSFLKLKPNWTWLGIKEQYSVPHQGIQDYFSALHIVITLKDYLKSSALPVSIREVLKQSVRATSINMAKYYNVLVHVAGLLHLLLDRVPKAITKEIVHLIREANRNLSDKCNVDQWLRLIENTKCNNDITREIAQFINTDKPICIRENQVLCCKVLFPHLRPSEVYIDIASEPDKVSDLLDLLKILTNCNHQCIGLALHHHYLHDDATTTSDEILQHVQPQDYLISFRGHLSDVPKLPPNLMMLYLAVVSDDHARRLLPQLHTVVPGLHYLDDLAVRVPAEVSPGELQPLPVTHKFVEVILSDVSDDGVSHACDVIHKLQPPGGYYKITCDPSTLTESGIRDMIHGLAKRSVKVGSGLIVNTCVALTQDQDKKLDSLALEKLCCYFKKAEEQLVQ
ncbi:uncharacterized protein [Cherax quadricarinatus]